MKAIVMSHGQIRHWMAWLLKNGWRRVCLARALGIDPHNVRGKIIGSSWIMKGEQLRLTRQLRSILAGQLVPSEDGLFPVVADDPVPLSQPPRYVFDLADMKLKTIVPQMPVPPMLPGWNDGLAKARVGK